MKNKVLVELLVPELGQSFSVFLPINKKIGNIITLLNRGIGDLSEQNYKGSNKTALYNRVSGIRYRVNDILYQTDIRNGSILILL